MEPIYSGSMSFRRDSISSSFVRGRGSAALRGVGRPSRRGRGTFRGSNPRLDEPAPMPLGSTVDSINIKTLLIEEDAPTVKNVRYVSSYNWLDEKSPIILVPGAPPTWTPPAVDQQLKPDSQDVFRDINAARHPSFPMEPAVRSILALQSNFNAGSVDVMACGSTIGNLLRFARSEAKAFRFDVDLVGETVFFVRKEKSPTELITDLRGYGHTFPEAYTTWDNDVRNSCSHQRIIEYDFGGLRFLVRSETDGYIRQTPPKQTSTAPTSLGDELGKMAVASAGFYSNQELAIRLQGTKVPQEQIFDIKTRSSQTIFDMNEILPRLWVNQTSKFLLAYHRFGLFDKPQVRFVRKEILEWEKNNAAGLGRLHAIVKRIVDLVRDSSDQQVEVSWDGEGPLLITEQLGDKRRALPSGLLKTWAAA